MGVAEQKKAHEVKIVGRREMCVSGVCEVISFDEESIRLMSSEGEVFVEGEDIKIGVLDTDRGVVTFSGKINGFYYLSDEESIKKDKKRKKLF